jgi:hypothetical protein
MISLRRHVLVKQEVFVRQRHSTISTHEGRHAEGQWCDFGSEAYATCLEKLLEGVAALLAQATT